MTPPTGHLRAQAVTEGLPPGPRLPRAVQTLLLATRPLDFLLECWRRYGDAFTVSVAPIGTTVYVSSPEAVKQVFTGDPAVFRAGAASHSNAVATSPGDEPAEVPRSLLLLDEDAHLHDRKLMLPPFQGRHVLGYGELIREIVADEVDRWPVGEPFRLRRSTQAMTLRVMLRVVFGMQRGERLERLYERLPGLLSIHPLFVWAPWLRRDFGAWSPERRYRALLEECIGLMVAEIRERRAAGDLEHRDDVLSLLVRAREPDGSPAFDDRGLAFELATLLLAGHETTASALAWGIDQLLHAPESLARLREDLEAGSQDYLEAVVRETLRTRPVLIGASRKLSRPEEIAGYRLPTGTVVRVAIAVVQARPDLYPEPEAFRPERFYRRKPDTSYAWIPFGGGVRHCLGASFALVEMKVAIAEILRRVELRAVSPKPDRGGFRHMLFVPSRGPRIVVTRRREAGSRPAAALALEPDPAGVGADAG